MRLTNPFKYRRFSCPELLEFIEELMMDKSSMKNDEKFEYYLNKFEHEEFYFYDILKYD